MKHNASDLLLVSLKAIGITPPKNVTAVAADRVRVREEAREAVAGNYPKLVEAWVNALLDGKDPLESPEVTRQAVAYTLGQGNLHYAAGAVVDGRVGAAVTASQGQILTDLKKACDDAGATLTDAHNVIGRLDLSETASIFRLGTVAVESHTKATAARRTIEKVMTAWECVDEITGFAGPTSERVVVLADLPLDIRNALRRKGDAWDIVRAGGTIDLAIDRDTLQARRARHAAEQKAAEAGVRDDWSKQARRALGTGAPILVGNRHGE